MSSAAGAPDHDEQIAALTARVQALEAWRDHQTDLLDELINGMPTAEPASDPAPKEDLDADGLVSWVHQCITGIIARPLRGELMWCPRWWEHPEAILRMRALHRAWAELASEPGVAMSLWLRDHLDPCLRELLNPLGPFADCAHNERYRSLNGHTPLATLPTAAPDGPLEHTG